MHFNFNPRFGGTYPVIQQQVRSTCSPATRLPEQDEDWSTGFLATGNFTQRVKA